MADRETAHWVRGMTARVVVRSINDSGGNQTANVTVYEGVDRSDVEIAQPFGFASNAPGGGLGYTFAVGGDQGDLVLLPVTSPAYRMGNLAPGESVLYGLDGSRVHVKKDGSIDAQATKEIKYTVGDLVIEIEKDSLLRVRFGEGAEAPRLTVTSEYVKMVCGTNALIVKKDGIYSTVPVVIGPDPEPEK